MKTKWVPAPAGWLYTDGERWNLYQTDHRKGYDHYLGRVCIVNGVACSDVGEYPTMHDAAVALLDAAKKGEL